MLGIIIQLKLEINRNLNFFKKKKFLRCSSLVEQNSKIRISKVFRSVRVCTLQRNFEIFYGMFIIIKHPK